MRKLQILGPGCPKCERLAKEAEAAARELGLEFELEKVTAMDRILDFGVMATPALAVDGRVRAAGKALDREDIKKLLE